MHLNGLLASICILLIVACILTIVQGELRPESDLTSHCYHFPAKDFGKQNNVKLEYGSSPKVILEVGDQAIDFSLQTPEGGDYITLSNLLSEKPVVLIWGQYTCPAWQGFHSDTTFPGSSYSDEFAFVEATKDKVTLVHIVGPEPHPIWPHANFDSGSLKLNLWSTIKQPQTYAERLSESVSRVSSYVHPNAILLVERLDGKTGAMNNAVWCSYANAARATILIGQDGVILATQDWFNK